MDVVWRDLNGTPGVADGINTVYSEKRVLYFITSSPFWGRISGSGDK